ncbi:MAG: hypothetical protein JXL97_19695 [Bacteroidales bacterium]|nr:hypothetical protein [Bacteroidales bacterium]
MKKLLLLFIFFTIIFQANAQLDSVINFCTKHLPFPYISDGQQYRALVTAGETAEFRMTFYGGATYRVVTASEPKENSVIFRLYDVNYNELFSNVNFNNSTYWDFQFTSTVECLIEAELPPGKQSGFIIMFLGFKQQ